MGERDGGRRPRNLVEVGASFAQAYAPVLDFDGWRVAMLRHFAVVSPATFHRVERHRNTNEVFILTAGSADLILCEGDERPEAPRVIVNDAACCLQRPPVGLASRGPVTGCPHRPLRAQRYRSPNNRLRGSCASRPRCRAGPIQRGRGGVRPLAETCRVGEHDAGTETCGEQRCDVTWSLPRSQYEVNDAAVEIGR